MEEKIIFDEVDEIKKSFGIKCKKLSGALTVEVLKKHLENHGFLVSNRDVFIEGVDSELDLLVVKKSSRPKYNLVYSPFQVVAVLEVKNYGSFGEKTTPTIRNIFGKIKSQNRNILCCYITLLERETYKHKVTSEKLGYPAYTIFFHKGTDKNFKLDPTGKWNEFLDELNKYR